MNEKEKFLILFTSLKEPVYKLHWKILKASKYNCSEPRHLKDRDTEQD